MSDIDLNEERVYELQDALTEAVRATEEGAVDSSSRRTARSVRP
ncbi:MAG: hypothetical protein ACR2H2_12830 [Solirubrobacteraceae bacterium]